MKIFIMNAHWNNRGDEAAVRAMIDELLREIPDARITVHIWVSRKVYQFPYKSKNVKYIYETYKAMKEAVFFRLLFGCFIKCSFPADAEFCHALKEADLVIYAPGGADISDNNLKIEMNNLIRLLYAKRLKKPYLFYAPSMGPFQIRWRNLIRRYVLKHSQLICVREPLSAGYIKDLRIKNDVYVTLDSAFQNDINSEECAKILEADQKLNLFLNNHDKIIGITITDLMWSVLYKNDRKLSVTIRDTFKRFIQEMIQQGYSILFIPQLFGEQNDSRYMKSFTKDNCFVLSDRYDCFFQQYLISRLYCVIGMRYHSNIFAAKMGTPFISISYQEKMRGFMKKEKLESYCLDIHELSFARLTEKFNLLDSNYQDYKQYLKDNRGKLKAEAQRTTRYVCKYINEGNLRNL